MQVMYTLLSCYIELMDGSSVEFIPLEENKGFYPGDFDFLKKVPITSSIDLYAYFSARDSIGRFTNKDEISIIPVLFLFSNDKITFAELLEKSNCILQEIDCKDGIISGFISGLKDINPEEFDSNEDLIHVVMDLISEVIGTQLFDGRFEVPSDPIPASRIRCLSIHFEDFTQRRYVDYDTRWEEFVADSKTLPESPDLDECPHFKYLMAKWSDYQEKEAWGVHSANRSDDGNVEWALEEGDINLLMPEWWFDEMDEELPINNWTPDYPEVFVFPEGRTRIRAQFTDQFRNLRKVMIPNSAEIIDEYTFASSDLESVYIPDGVKIIGDKAFYGNRYLKSVHLPKNLEKIGSYAFDECNSELILKIPESVREIGSTERLDLLKFAIEHGIDISIDFTTRPDILKFAVEHNIPFSIGFTTKPDLLEFAIEHNMPFSADSLRIYRTFKELMKESDAEVVRLLINAFKIPYDFMDFWHVGVMHNAIEFGTAEQTAALLNSGKLEFTDDELEYLIDYAAEIGKTEHTVCLLNYKNEIDGQDEEDEEEEE